MKIKPCEVCGQQFSNIFEMIDHLSDDEGVEPFDPAMVLPNGYKFLVGTLLRLVYEYSNKPSNVRAIVSEAYSNLYLAETNQEAMRTNVEDAIVERFIKNLDKELAELLEDNDNTE